ncbi:ketoacyl-ACP synthase III [bacterium]|nr:ketoacyl-ACP synthase III [bacterium]
MQNTPEAMIVSTGHAVPDKKLTNSDLEKMVNTSDQWIVERTGMRERRIAEAGTLTSDLAAEAAKKALEKANVSPKELDVIILATISGDMQFPATACFVQQKLGAENAAAFDISAACSGFIYALKIANGLISSGDAKNVMVIGAEILSRFTDYTDRNTCILFGDGAGAALLQPSDGTRGLLGTYWKSNGNLTHLLLAPGSGSAHPPSHETVDAGLHYLKMAGREVFKHAVNSMANAALSALEITGLSGADIDLLISHQANDRIIRATAQKAKIQPEKVFVNIEKYGNTSSASIPIAMDEAITSGKLKTGDKCLIVAFGGGLTWGSAIIQF